MYFDTKFDLILLDFVIEKLVIFVGIDPNNRCLVVKLAKSRDNPGRIKEHDKSVRVALIKAELSNSISLKEFHRCRQLQMIIRFNNEMFRNING